MDHSLSVTRSTTRQRLLAGAAFVSAAARQELGRIGGRVAPSTAPLVDLDSPSPVLSALAGMARARLDSVQPDPSSAAATAAVHLVGGMTFEGSPVNVVFCDGATGLPIEVPADLSTISREKLEGLGIRAATREEPTAAQDSKLQAPPIEIRVNDISLHDDDENAANVQYEVVGSNQILTLPSGDPVSTLRYKGDGEGGPRFVEFGLNTSDVHQIGFTQLRGRFLQGGAVLDIKSLYGVLWVLWVLWPLSSSLARQDFSWSLKKAGNFLKFLKYFPVLRIL